MPIAEWMAARWRQVSPQDSSTSGDDPTQPLERRTLLDRSPDRVEGVSYAELPGTLPEGWEIFPRQFPPLKERRHVNDVWQTGDPGVADYQSRTMSPEGWEIVPGQFPPLETPWAVDLESLPGDLPMTGHPMVDDYIRESNRYRREREYNLSPEKLRRDLGAIGPAALEAASYAPGLAYDMTIGSILSIPEDIKAAFSFGERGEDSRWWKDVGDVGLLAAGFLPIPGARPGARAAKAMFRAVDDKAADASRALGEAVDAMIPDSAARSSLANRRPDIYDLPHVERSFWDDYQPGSFSPDEIGRPLGGDDLDIYGRPLGNPRFIVGNRLVGGEHEAFAGAQLDALATQGLGISLVPTEGLRALGAFGVYGKAPVRVMDGSGLAALASPPEDGLGRIFLDSHLSPEDRSRVLGEELGHALEDRLGRRTIWITQPDGLQGSFNIIPESIDDPGILAKPSSGGEANAASPEPSITRTGALP